MLRMRATATKRGPAPPRPTRDPPSRRCTRATHPPRTTQPDDPPGRLTHPGRPTRPTHPGDPPHPPPSLLSAKAGMLVYFKKRDSRRAHFRGLGVTHSAQLAKVCTKGEVRGLGTDRSRKNNFLTVDIRRWCEGKGVRDNSRASGANAIPCYPARRRNLPSYTQFPRRAS